MRVKIYAEGGGRGHLLDTLFRQGWSDFFRKAGLGGRMPRVVRGGSREQAFELFSQAIQDARPGQLPMLLVDSEGPVSARRTVWQHLERPRPEGAANDQAFLMVQVMETWFLADRALLVDYFGSALRENHFRDWPDLESVSKETVLLTLKKATAGCRKSYAKGRVSYELLSRLNPERVEEACPHGRALLDRLRAL